MIVENHSENVNIKSIGYSDMFSHNFGEMAIEYIKSV